METYCAPLVGDFLFTSSMRQIQCYLSLKEFKLILLKAFILLPGNKTTCFILITFILSKSLITSIPFDFSLTRYFSDTKWYNHCENVLQT